MALTGLTRDYPMAYGKGWAFLALKVTVGASGAVASVDGKGWTSDGVAGTGPMRSGSVTKETGDGEYTIVCPGDGAFHDLFLVAAHVEDDADLLVPRISGLDLSARSLTVEFVDPGDDSTAPAAANPSANTVLHFLLLVKDSNVD